MRDLDTNCGVAVHRRLRRILSGLRVEAPQDVTDFAIATGRLTVTDAAVLLEAFQQMATDRIDADAERAVAEEREVPAGIGATT